MSIVIRLNVLSKWLFSACIATSATAQALSAPDSSCRLKYPIVLSHHWGMRHICSHTAPATGPSSCVEAEDFERYCADKVIHASGQRLCARWQVPQQEEALPPRNFNEHDPRLTRQVSGFHRYFSQSIVDALARTCGNQVYLSDKPPFASTELRARSLRLTVLKALQETKADKVIVIGVSQGVNDARFMASRLDADSAHTQNGTMKHKVAAIVSLVGEDGGAESASLALNSLYLLNWGRWHDHSRILGWTEALFNSISWQMQTPQGPHVVITEQCQGQAECHPTVDQKYQWTVRSYFDLSTRYMRPNRLERLLNKGPGWQGLRAYLGVPENSWQDIIPESIEADNGIAYFNYAAKLGQWDAGWGSNLSLDRLTYWLIHAIAGDNDGYVSLSRQKFANRAANFHHMTTMVGAPDGRGYHHLFFTGRNEALYTPAPQHRQTAPYNGNVAQVYQQIARDLKKSGF